MSIICGTDFSALATEAADAAAVIAARSKEPLLLAHVIGDEFSVEADAGSSKDCVQPVLSKRLSEKAERLRHVYGITVEEELLVGITDEALIHLAQRTGARMIVVSHLGRRLPERWLLGSTADRLAQTCPVPVMIVRKAQPFKAWTEGNALNVFVCVDFTATSDAALASTKDLCQLGACNVIAGHIAWPPGEIERLAIHAKSMSLVKLAPEIENVLQRDLLTKVTSVLPKECGAVKICIVPGFGRTDSHLDLVASHEKADLIVVGTHHRSGISRLWHSAVSRGIVHLADTNVLIAPVLATAPSNSHIPRIANVAVTTDFSESGNRAIPYAYALLGAGSTVHLVHVIHPGLIPDSVSAYSLDGHEPTDKRSRYLCHLDEQLRALVPAEATERGIKTKVLVLEEDDIVKGVCASAERLGADLVCIGSHGRTGLMKALIGSVAQGILAHCKRPVLVIRTPGSDA